MGLARILELARTEGLASEFCETLTTNITGFIETMKLKGFLPASISSEVTVTPNPVLFETLERAADIEELQDLYTDAANKEEEKQEGIYKCTSCDHRNVYSKDILEELDQVICPNCGGKMLYAIPADFNPFALWDGEEILKFDITFKEDILNEIMEEVYQKFGEDLQEIASVVEEATSNRDHEIETARTLNEHYKAPLSIPQIWINILECIQEPFHEDIQTRIKGWLLALAKAYNVIDDFYFSVTKEEIISGGVGKPGYNISIRYTFPEEDRCGTPKVSYIPAIDLSCQFMMELFKSFLRKLEESKLMPAASKHKAIGALLKLEDKLPMLAETLGDISDTYIEPVDALRPLHKMILGSFTTDILE